MKSFYGVLKSECQHTGLIVQALVFDNWESCKFYAHVKVTQYNILFRMKVQKIDK